MDLINAFVASYRGELAALTTAFLWAFGSMVYSRISHKIPALELNLLKVSIAIFFLVFTILFQKIPLPATPTKDLYLLLLSGAIGIGISDTFFMKALKYLGARRTLLVRTTDPPTTAFLSSIFLQETLTMGAWSGIFLVVLAVSLAISERIPTGSQPINLDKKFSKFSLENQGIFFALLSALGQSVGAVITRQVLVETDINPIWSVLLRLLGGIAMMLIWMSLKQYQMGLWLREMSQKKSLFQLLGILSLASFLSTFLGIWLQQTALKFTAAGVAQTLCATTPLFVLSMAVLLGDKVSFKAILSVLLALAGVAFLLN